MTSRSSADPRPFIFNVGCVQCFLFLRGMSVGSYTYKYHSNISNITYKSQPNDSYRIFFLTMVWLLTRVDSGFTIAGVRCCEVKK